VENTIPYSNRDQLDELRNQLADLANIGPLGL